jgi:hypothetical protein
VRPQGQRGKSGSLAVYALLLRLYPRDYLRRHGEELLENFQDLERELPSKAALWCFMARDLAVSLRLEFLRTFWGQTTGVFTLLSGILAFAHRYAGKHELYLWSCCCGYALGWFAGWFGFDWRMRAGSRFPTFVRSFRGQAAMLLGAITLVSATTNLFVGLSEPLVLIACYGVVLAWMTGWFKNKRRMSL